MSESTTLRDLIARALYEHHGAGFGGGNFHTWNEIVEGGESRPYPEYPHLVDEFRARADAVLAVLADLPDEVIEKAIRAVDSLDWSHLEFGEVPNSRETVTSVLTAVFGGEQGE